MLESPAALRSRDTEAAGPGRPVKVPFEFLNSEP